MLGTPCKHCIRRDKTWYYIRNDAVLQSVVPGTMVQRGREKGGKRFKEQSQTLDSVLNLSALSTPMSPTDSTRFRVTLPITPYDDRSGKETLDPYTRRHGKCIRTPVLCTV